MSGSKFLLADIVRYFMYILILLSLFCLANVFGAYLELTPRPLALATVAIGIWEGRDRGAYLGGVAGLIAGAYSGLTGVYILAYYTLGGVSGLLGERVFPQRFMSAYLPALVFITLETLLFPQTALSPLHELWRQSVYLFIASPAVFLMLKAALKLRFTRVGFGDGYES